MITYLLQVTICWGLFLGLYHLTLRKETFFMVNRTYLLLTIVLGLAIPRMTWDTSMFMEQPTIEMAVDYMAVSFDQLTAVVTPEVETESMGLLAMIYWVGVILMMCKLAYGIIRILLMRYRADITMDGDQAIAYTTGDHAPFTFFGTIYLSKDRNDEDRDPEILTHEQAHVNGWHTLDVLFVEIVKAFFWFNPLVYGYDHALKTVHEYIADANVLQRTALQRYGRLLLRQAQPGLEIALANHFYNSQLKKRFNMMTRTPSQKRMLLKYLSVLPFILVVSLVFTNQSVQAEINKVEEIDLEGIFSDPDNIESDYKILLSEIESSFSSSEKTVQDALSKICQPMGKLNQLYKQSAINSFDGASYTNESITGRLIIEAPKNDNNPDFRKDLLITVWMEMADPIIVNGSRFVDCSLYDSPSQTQTEYEQFTFPSIQQNLENHLSKRAELKDGATSRLIFNEYQKHLYTTPDQDALKILYINWCEENGLSTNFKGLRLDGVRFLKPMASTSINKEINFQIEVTKSKNKLNLKCIEGCDWKYLTLDTKVSKNKLISYYGIVSPIRDLAKGKDRNQKTILSADEKTKHKYFFDLSYANENISLNGIHGVVWNVLGGSLTDHSTALINNSGILVTGERKLPSIDSLPAEREVFRVVQVKPEFPNGQEAMFQYIFQNLTYPAEARKAGVQGTAVIGFIVEADGSMSNIIMRRDPGAGTGAEALRVIEKMSNEITWSSGKQNGQNVAVLYNIPIRFKLDTEEKNTQIAPPPPPPTQEQIQESINRQRNLSEDKIFKVVDVKPEFPGGQEALFKYIFTYLKYPTEARVARIQGNSVIGFTIEKDGSVSNLELRRDPGAGLGAEALRVVTIMAENKLWKPGMQDGKPVRVQYNLPIKFKLETEESEKPKIINSDDLKIMPEFSPDGDGINDGFIIEGIEKFKDSRVEIFNLWGNKVFTKTNYSNDNPWKGQWNGKDVPDATYFYQINDVDGTLLKTGWVKILRETTDAKPANKNPLIVIYNNNDKVVFNLKGFDAGAVNTDDIERVNVLKGDKATDKYGDKAENGVIEIYMKAGKVNIPDELTNKESSEKSKMNFASLNIFPNPVSNILTVDIKSIESQTRLLLTSIDGRVLYEERIMDKQSINMVTSLGSKVSLPDFQVTHNMDQYPSGVYIVSIIQGDKVYSQPVVKK